MSLRRPVWPNFFSKIPHLKSKTLSLKMRKMTLRQLRKISVSTSKLKVVTLFLAPF